MIGPEASAAIESALRHRRALLKVLSANDAGLTRSHQAGFLLPTRYWQFFSEHAPERGENLTHDVRIHWPDGRVTGSVVTWYGKEKSEYRLTRFGRDFPYRTPDVAGGLLVLVELEPRREFEGFVLTSDEEIEEIQAALGVDLSGPSALFDATVPVDAETEEECLERRFREVLRTLGDAFPTTAAMSQYTLDALRACVDGFAEFPPDDRLMRSLETEFRLFRRVERQICSPEVTRVFASVDDFIRTAQTILQRRKSRAGKSLENHVYSILQDQGVAFARQVRLESSTVDLLIPDARSYFDEAVDRSRVLTVAIKTTCKDRWRQILPEAPRVPVRHLITVQKGISARQVEEMRAARVQLVVPRALHREYPDESRAALLTIEGFVEQARRACA